MRPCTVSGYTLTTFPNTIHAATATTKCKGKSNNRQQQTKEQSISNEEQGLLTPMALPTVTMFTKRSCLLCFGLGKYISGLYPVWSQISGSISGSIFISISSISGSFMFAKISYNSVASESPSSKSSSSTSI